MRLRLRINTQHTHTPSQPPSPHTHKNNNQKVCLAAETCGHVAFETRRDVWYSAEPLHCGPALPDPAGVSFWDLYRKVALTAMLWGAGTAVGEVPPYFLSYKAAVAGGRSAALAEVEESLAAGALMFWVEWLINFDRLMMMGDSCLFAAHQHAATKSSQTRNTKKTTHKKTRQVARPRRARRLEHAGVDDAPHPAPRLSGHLAARLVAQRRL